MVEDTEGKLAAAEENLREEKARCAALRQEKTMLEEQQETGRFAAAEREVQLIESLRERMGALDRACVAADSAMTLVSEQRAEIARLTAELEAAKAEVVAERSWCATVEDEREEEVARLEAEVEEGQLAFDELENKLREAAAVLAAQQEAEQQRKEADERRARRAGALIRMRERGSSLQAEPLATSWHALLAYHSCRLVPPAR